MWTMCPEKVPLSPPKKCKQQISLSSLSLKKASKLCIPQIETHGWWQTHSHTFLASPVCSPDSMWSSDRTALPPLVRSCLKDQSGEVIQTGTGGREDLSPFMMLQSPVRKTLCLCSSIRTNVASKCCWHLRLLPCCCFFALFPLRPQLNPSKFPVW